MFTGNVMFLDESGNVVLLFIESESKYVVCHKSIESSIELDFALNEGMIPFPYYKLTPAEWEAVDDWNKAYGEVEEEDFLDGAEV
jgi:hypothetical protein